MTAALSLRSPFKVVLHDNELGAVVTQQLGHQEPDRPGADDRVWGFSGAGPGESHSRGVVGRRTSIHEAAGHRSC